MKLIKAVGLIDDLAAAVKNDILSASAFGIVKRFIYRQDAVDAVEVVRCKDCKHCKTVEGYGHYCDYSAGTMCDVYEDDFCSCGKKR